MKFSCVLTILFSLLGEFPTSQRKGPQTIRSDGILRSDLKSRRAFELVCRNGGCAKKNGSIRICVDLRPLNKCVMRETHPLPKVDDILLRLMEASCSQNWMLTLDFWQVPLANNSQHITTFLTHFGRSKFNKLPFGICSAPEVFQKRMNQILQGLQVVLCLIDDVLIFGKSEMKHGFRLHAALQRLGSAGVTLNVNKCSFFVRRIKFLDHIKKWLLSAQGCLSRSLNTPLWLDPSNLPSYCGYGNKLTTEHAFSCAKGGFPSIRHNEIRDITATQLTEVCHNVSVEPDLQPIINEMMHFSTANTDDGARLDIAAGGFWGGSSQRTFLT